MLAILATAYQNKHSKGGRKPKNESRRHPDGDSSIPT